MNITQGSTNFLKVIIFLVGIAVLVVCVCMPGMAIKDAKVHPETAFFLIPLLVFAYIFFIAFSVALYQLFKLITYIEMNRAFSKVSLNSLQIIKKCALIAIFVIFLAFVNFTVLAKVIGSDDGPGPRALCLMGILATSIIAAIVDVLQKPLKNQY